MHLRQAYVCIFVEESGKIIDQHRHFQKGAGWTEHVVFIGQAVDSKGFITAIPQGPSSKAKGQKKKPRRRCSEKTKAMLKPPQSSQVTPSNPSSANQPVVWNAASFLPGLPSEASTCTLVCRCQRFRQWSCVHGCHQEWYAMPLEACHWQLLSATLSWTGTWWSQAPVRGHAGYVRCRQTKLGPTANRFGIETVSPRVVGAGSSASSISAPGRSSLEARILEAHSCHGWWRLPIYCGCLVCWDCHGPFRPAAGGRLVLEDISWNVFWVVWPEVVKLRSVFDCAQPERLLGWRSMLHGPVAFVTETSGSVAMCSMDEECSFSCTLKTGWEDHFKRWIRINQKQYGSRKCQVCSHWTIQTSCFETLVARELVQVLPDSACRYRRPIWNTAFHTDLHAS